MIHTLRLTGVAVVILAGVVMASVAVPAWRFGFGGHDDERVRKILDAPSAVDRFQSQYGDKGDAGQDATPALVRQAQTFAGILNPPAPVAARTPMKPNRITPTRRAEAPQTSQHFDLVGTSYSSINPASSFAYIRLADRSYQWVRPGDEVGHTVIREICDGYIVCGDGQRMMAEPTVDTASLLETGSVSTPSDSRPVAGVKTAAHLPPTSSSAAQPALAASNGRSPAAPRPAPGSEMTQADQDALQVLVDRLKQSDMDPASKAAAVSRLITEFKARQAGTAATEQSQENPSAELTGDREGRQEALEERRREFLKRMSTPRGAGH